MKNFIMLLAVVTIGCGDNKTIGDAKNVDARPDAHCSDCPPAPQLGAQIDRMGRPTINTALNRGFTVPSATVTAAKDAYNQAADPSTWIAFVPQFMRSLAIVDSLDTGICGNGICEVAETNANCPTPTGDCGAAAVGSGNGCGNQALYNGLAGGGGPPMAMSYAPLAAILANDELYVDTSKTNCVFYLAVEFTAATGAMNTTCGGRTPQYDVIDFTLSLAAMGLRGFDIPGGFIPQFKDNAPPHGDYLTEFPYLGPPH